MKENTPEFLKFVKECQNKFVGISLPTIEILYLRKISEAKEESKTQETTKKKSKK